MVLAQQIPINSDADTGTVPLHVSTCVQVHNIRTHTHTMVELPYFY